MLKPLVFLAALFAGSAVLIASAQTNRYLIFSSQAACLARSQAMCASMKCDGVQTKYWWSCTALSAGMVGPTAVFPGSYALVIESGDPQFDVSAANAVGSGALSSGEQAALKSQSAMSGVLPSASAAP